MSNNEEINLICVSFVRVFNDVKENARDLSVFPCIQIKTEETILRRNIENAFYEDTKIK